MSIVAFVIFAIAAVFGIESIKIDDSLSQLFRADTPEFRQFEEVSRQFPSSEYDLLVVVEGRSLLERDSIEKLRSLVTDLQLIDGALGAISLFSVRQPGGAGGIPEPLLPEELPQGSKYQELVHQVASNELVRGKLLSEDGTLALIVLSLDPTIVGGDKLQNVVDDVRHTARDDLQGAELTTQVSGVPAMQLEIRNALKRDRLVYNAIGFLLGCGIAIAFFRRLAFMLIAAGPPLVAIVLSVGALGWLGFRLNIFLNVMTPLIMVISFSDSMQLTFAVRDRILGGEDKRTAFRNSIVVVGPACVLTHAAAALSFLGLLISDSQLIRTFGEAGCLSTAVALVTVLSLAPALGVLAIRDEATFVATLKRGDVGVNTLRGFCAWIAARVVRRPDLYSLAGLVVVGSLAIVYLGLPPRYRLADEVPDREQALQANSKLDRKLTGANPIDVLVRFPPGIDLFAPDTLAVIAKTHHALEGQAGVGNVWSLETLREWLDDKLGKRDVATLRQYVDLLPQSLARRFISEDRDAVIVSGRVPEKDAAGMLPILNQLDQRLDTLRAEYPGYTIAPTGLSVIAARNSAEMIHKLNRGLTIEFVFVAAFIGLAFRSWPVTLASLTPGLFPVVSAGALLRLLGVGLQFSSVVALTVSLGLSLSATLHFLNRMALEDRSDHDPAIAVERATSLVGPALILTSIVLACGLAALALSELPALRLFGWLSAFAMLAALVADLLILRPTITFLLRRSRRAAPSVSGGSPTLLMESILRR